MTRVVVVGAGLAGLRTAEALRVQGYTGDLTIIGAEPHRPYDRPPLSKSFLLGTAREQDVMLASHVQLAARWRLGTPAVALDLPGRRVVLADGEQEPYDGLVLATGARPRALPGFALDPEQVAGLHLLRTLDDARQLRAALRGGRSQVVVVGAGFIGSEVAAAAIGLGCGVTLVEAGPLPLLGALGPDLADYLAGLHRRHGVDLRLHTPVLGVETHADDGHARSREPTGEPGQAAGRRRVSAVVVQGDAGLPQHLETDVAVVGLGAVPNTDWLADSGLRIAGGVVCDASLTALGRHGPVAGVVAAGDLARWPHPLFDGELVRVEHWSNAVDQAKAAARTLLTALTGRGRPEPFGAVPSFWSDQYDRKILSVGLPHLATDSAVLAGDPAAGRFLVGYGRDGRLVGAAAVDLPGQLAKYRRLVAQRAPWPPPLPRAVPVPATGDPAGPATAASLTGGAP